MKSINLQEMESSELLTLYSEVLDTLRQRKVIRSTNNPVADYAERLVSKALALNLERKSSTGFDAHDANDIRYEIKSRRITSHNKSRQLSAIRGLDKDHFHFLAGVLFTQDFKVYRACLIPLEIVKREATYKTHVNAWVFHLRDSVWGIQGVKDITEKIVLAQKEASR